MSSSIPSPFSHPFAHLTAACFLTCATVCPSRQVIATCIPCHSLHRATVTSIGHITSAPKHTVGRLNHRRESPSSVKYRSGPPSSSPADRARSSSSSSFSLSPSSGQKHPPSPSPVWSSNEPRRSSSSATAGATVSLDLEPSQGRPPSRPSGERRSEQWTAVSREDMSRRRSDGYGLGGKSSRRGGQDNMHPFQHHQQQQQQQQHYPLNGQQQRYAQQHPQQKHPKNQASLQLFSMKSSPNLAYPDRLETREYDPGGARPVQAPSSSLYKRNNSRSSPNIHADMNTPETSQQAYSRQPGPQQQQQQQQSQVPPDYMNMARSTPDLLISPGPSRHLSTTTFPGEDKASPHSKSSSSQASLPASHGLHRYQADYENLSHLGTQPLGSEKISEISDIDEITGQDSLPTSPDPQRSSGKGHEHSERSPPHPLSNLKTYAENEPRNAAKMGSSNFVGSAPVGGPPTRDPMTLKYIKVNQSHEKYPSWPVTQPSGGAARGDQADTINSRAQSMTDHTNTSKEFPKKQRLAYTPGLRPLAERNSPTGGAEENGKTSRNASDPGFQKSEFVYDRMGRVQKSGHDAVDQRFEDFYKNSQPGYPPPAMDSDGHNIGDKEYSAPSPPERDAKAISERELSQHLAGFMSSDKEASAMPPNSNLATSESDYSRQEVAKVDSGTSPMEDPGSQSMHEDNVAPRPISHSKSERFRPSQVQYREGAMQPNIQRDRPSSYTASLSARESGFKPAGGNNKGVIVRSTPYYNTSTQTDMMPYAIKVSDPLVVASRLRNAQVQVNEVSPQTSPKSPQQQFEEKSIQARMSREFQDPNVSERESSDHLKRWLRTGLGTDTANPKQDAKQQVGKASSNDNYFNYPAVTSAANSTNYLLLSHQSSPFPGIKSIQAKYATDEGPNDTEDRTIPNTSVSSASIPGAADDHSSIRSAFIDNSASILRKLSEEFYGNRQQRMSSNSTATHSSTSSMSAGPDQKLHSPRLESAVQQPGLREAESYSSVVIHPDQSFGLFGRDDYVSSVSSLSGDSNKHDSSNYSDVSVGGTSYSSRLHQEKISRDAVGTSRSRRSLDPSYFSQKSRLQSQDPRVSSSTASLFGPRSQLYHHQRELSAPVSSTSSLSLSQSPHSLPQSSTTAPGSNKARPHHLSIISDSSLGSNPKSSSSEARSSQSTSNAASPSATQLGSLPNAEEAQGTTISNMRPFSASSAASAQSDEALKRLSSRRGSDSVFVGDDDLSDDYQFNRKPSMRKAYGIYDETERLISMSSKLPDKGKTNSASVASVSSGSTSGLSDHQAPASSRSHAFTVGLGLIREEGGDSSSDGKTAAVPPAGGERGAEQKNEPPQKYAWQNEAWLRSRIDLPKGSNLKRTTSEQIGVLKVGEDSNAHQTTYSNYENSRMLLGRPGASGSQHGRTQSGDFTNLGREAELKRMQQQAVLSFYQRKTTASTPSPSDHSRQFPGKAGYTSAGAPGAVSQSLSSLSYSPDSSLYESIGGKSSGGGSPTESVADIISKANENLAKSAQRVDSIRRSNSTTKSYSSAGYGFSAEYMDMAARHERMRKETDWSRLRSSGSLRYSPESSSTDPRRSNRSSFASENHYEDISMFAPSTPRGSVSESVPDSGFSGGKVSIFQCESANVCARKTDKPDEIEDDDGDNGGYDEDKTITNTTPLLKKNAKRRRKI
ncbi:hypothetical protein PoB_000314900 [Plakobranchus ocellatus]|uniref:Uncharacterized protein n=1 Tax=Plakobranchus ocellatus TaxID=259542 RepID=A0AAV3Y3J2_9GAST|nr:hypothetical protein PoB_000314900 [Plakobranchus ocellatus]